MLTAERNGRRTGRTSPSLSLVVIVFAPIPDRLDVTTTNQSHLIVLETVSGMDLNGCVLKNKVEKIEEKNCTSVSVLMGPQILYISNVTT